jgi:hypothetical protein
MPIFVNTISLLLFQFPVIAVQFHFKYRLLDLLQLVLYFLPLAKKSGIPSLSNLKHHTHQNQGFLAAAMTFSSALFSEPHLVESKVLKMELNGFDITWNRMALISLVTSLIDPTFFFSYSYRVPI